MRAHSRYHHALADLSAAGERRLIAGIAIAFIPPKPNLTIGAVPIPTKIPVRDRPQGQELETAEQGVVLGYLDPLTEDLDRHQLFVGMEKVAVHVPEAYNRPFDFPNRFRRQ